MTSKRSSSEIFPVAYAPVFGERGDAGTGECLTVRFEGLPDVNGVTLLEAKSWTVKVPNARLDRSTVDDNRRLVHPKSSNGTPRHVFVAT